jgi:pilus assembly protein TadC
VTVLAAALLAGAVLAVGSGHLCTRNRLLAVLPRPSGPPPRRAAPERGRGWGGVVVASLGAAVWLGGLAGMAAGCVVAVVLAAVVRRSAGTSPAPTGVDDLPLLLELLAAALDAGAPVPLALDAAATALGGPLLESLRALVVRMRLGGDPRAAGDGTPGAVLVEVLIRAETSGAAVAPALRRLAGDLREEERQRRTAAVRRLEVLVVVPLGLCFLPAFLLVGVVPVVAGLVPSIVPP